MSHPSHEKTIYWLEDGYEQKKVYIDFYFMDLQELRGESNKISLNCFSVYDEGRWKEKLTHKILTL